MKLAIAGMDAIRITRALRCRRIDLDCLAPTGLAAPDITPSRRLRPGALPLDELCLSQKRPTPERRLAIAVPSRDARLRAAFVRNVIMNPEDMGANPFREASERIVIPCPELLFVCAGAFMRPAIQLAFGLELCGTFSRDPADPIHGAAVLGIRPATTRDGILAFLDGCCGITGIEQSRRLAPYLCDDAWSPMEAVLASLLALPFGDLGYDLAPITLNKRVEAARPSRFAKASRVPDILIDGTRVGINYDGGGHLDLQAVIDAAGRQALNPGSSSRDDELRDAAARLRAKYVDDRRRDRELWAQGLLVMPVVYEDLAEPGALDHLVGLMLDEIVREGARDVSLQQGMLRSRAIARRRQQLVWSLLPSRQGRRAREELERATGARPREVEVELGPGWSSKPNE